MKAKFSGFITFLFLAFLLLCSSSVSARFLLQINNHGEKELKANEMMMIQADRKDDFSELMGAEECYEQDEECVKRRMMADAHLDYIYTQNHKP